MDNWERQELDDEYFGRFDYVKEAFRDTGTDYFGSLEPLDEEME